MPRVQVDVTPVNASSTLFGRQYASSIGISAVGSANASVEEIARVAPEHLWYQLYAPRDVRLSDHMIGRARDAGVSVLVYTVDFPVRPRNEAMMRTASPPRMGGVCAAWGGCARRCPGVRGPRRRQAGQLARQHLAHALGATHCFVGRATLYGVIAGGRAGAHRAVEILQSEMVHTMAMIGCKSTKDIGPPCLAQPSSTAEEVGRLSRVPFAMRSW